MEIVREKALNHGHLGKGVDCSDAPFGVAVFGATESASQPRHGFKHMTNPRLRDGLSSDLSSASRQVGGYIVPEPDDDYAMAGLRDAEIFGLNKEVPSLQLATS